MAGTRRSLICLPPALKPKREPNLILWRPPQKRAAIGTSEKYVFSYCVGSFSGYFASMDWQQLVSLLIVAVAAALLVMSRLRRSKFKFHRATHCGCSSPGSGGSPPSITFHARKGERPEIVVKSR